MAIDKVDIASKNWAEDYLTKNGRRFNNMLRDAFITGFKKGASLSRKAGTWIKEPDRERHWHCSVCDTVFGLTHYDFNYCPVCGARMEGEME